MLICQDAARIAIRRCDAAEAWCPAADGRDPLDQAEPALSAWIAGVYDGVVLSPRVPIFVSSQD
ncbi:hypothetical protein ACLBWX_18260 [Methylobacterium sp. M6A4_1b]